jgi:hypothetical protein
MWPFVVSAFLFLAPLRGHAVEHILAWDYTARPDDTVFVVERCVNHKTCTFADVAALPLTEQTYSEQVQNRAYCYRMRVENSTQGTYISNIVCT